MTPDDPRHPLTPPTTTSQTQTHTQTHTGEGSPRANRVWQRLVEIYGSTLVSNFGTEPPLTWVRAIEAMDDAQVIRALEGCARDESKFPPSLGQFRSWGRPSLVPPYATPMLPKPRNVELARSVLGELKKRLAGA